MTDEADTPVSPGKISWKQGMFVALGVPLLILPSLADIGKIAWGLCIVIWTVSVLQGFVQNLAYGEMVTVFPRATGLPGCAQIVFKPEVEKSPTDIRKFVGAFSAWCYAFAWCPVVTIFSMLIGDYIVAMFGLDISGYTYWGLYIAVGLCIVIFMTALGSRGLDGGAAMSTVLAILSIVPIACILIAAYAKGMFHFDNITSQFLPTGWSWSIEEIVLVCGCFALAQWSACAWETAAIYGPKYENPGHDVPHALFGCGIICLIMFFFISFSVWGDLGTTTGFDALIVIARDIMGDAGAYIAGILLIAAMVLIIQTGFLGSSHTFHSMSVEGNLPKWFGELNSRGQPLHAMIFVSAFNMLLVVVIGYSGAVTGNSHTSMTVLSASALGYAIANGIALAAFCKSHTDKRYKDLDRPFAAPKMWHLVINVFVILQFFVYVPCLSYWSYYSSDGSVLPLVLGIIILSLFVPLWLVVQKHRSVD